MGADEYHDQREFQVYKGLLTHYSSYFRTALNGKWKEGADKTVRLPEDNPDVFKVFFHWIMTGRLFTTINTEIPLTEHLICEIFVFGDARGIPELCNVAIDVFFAKSVQTLNFYMPTLGYIYENTLPGSALRRFVVNFAVMNLECKDLVLETNPREFLADLIMESAKMEKVPGSPGNFHTYTHRMKGELCQYHDHSVTGASSVPA